MSARPRFQQALLGQRVVKIPAEIAGITSTILSEKPGLYLSWGAIGQHVTD